MGDENSLEPRSRFVEPRQTTNATDSRREVGQLYPSGFSDDAALLVVIIASLIAVMSGVFVMYGMWRSKRQHRRLRKVVEMDSNDFLLYAQIAQQELSSTPCKTSLPCQMPYVGGTATGVSSYPIIVPGYVRIVQVTHPAAKEQNHTQEKLRSVVVEKPTNQGADSSGPPGPNLPKSTSSAPAILSGLWKQRHLLTGNKDALVDSFTSLKRPARPQCVRASMSDTSPMMIDRSVDQSRESMCKQCGSSGSSLLGGTFPRNISCRLCRERAGIRDVGTAAKKNSTVQEPNSSAGTTTDLHTAITERPRTALPVIASPSPKSPGRPTLSTFPDYGRRKYCTPEVRAQLDPFRTMVLASSSSEDLTSDSD